MTPFERLVETRFPVYGAVATLVVLVGGLGGLLLTSVWLKARANHTRIGEYFGLARRPKSATPPNTTQERSGA